MIGVFADDAVPPPEFGTEERVHPLRWPEFRAPHYPVKGRQEPYIPYKLGDFDLAPLWLAREHPEYRSIWLFEGDVDFTGPLGRLVRHFDDVPADLLATNLRQPRPDWPNLRRAVLPGGWPEDLVVGQIAMLTAFRASRALLDGLERFYAEGGGGHHEWSWPYVARALGLTVADIADHPIDGRTLYTSSRDVPGMYPGSFRFRPPMAKPGRRPMTLWHPVKDRPVGMGEYATQAAKAVWQLSRNAVRGRRG